MSSPNKHHQDASKLIKGLFINNSEDLARVLEALPSSDQFMKGIHMKTDSTTNEQRFIIPYLKELHHVIHELLPKPNRGLWEPELKLDPKLLSYFVLYYQNEDVVPPNDNNSNHNNESSDDESISDSASDDFIQSRL
jgi:hypothetical protein